MMQVWHIMEPNTSLVLAVVGALVVPAQQKVGTQTRPRTSVLAGLPALDNKVKTVTDVDTLLAPAAAPGDHLVTVVARHRVHVISIAMLASVSSPNPTYFGVDFCQWQGIDCVWTHKITDPRRKARALTRKSQGSDLDQSPQ